MELEEVQNIWSAQNDQAPYRIDLNELHRRIQSKKAKAMHITNFTERLILIVCFGTAALTWWINLTNAQHSFFIFCYAAWMVVVAVLVIIGRSQRLKAARQFDRSVQGELKQGLAVADYQVRLSQLMRWNIFIIGGLIIFSFWESAKPWWASLIFLMFLMATWFASGFEHRFYRRQKRKLEELRDSLNA